MEIICPVCGVRFEHPERRVVRVQLLRRLPGLQRAWACGPRWTSTPWCPTRTRRIDDGAVLPWNCGGRRLSMYAAGELGVRLDVPFRELTDARARHRAARRAGAAPGHAALRPDGPDCPADGQLRERRRRGGARRCAATTSAPAARCSVSSSPGVCSVCHGTRLRPEALTLAARRPQPGPDQRAEPGGAARLRRQRCPPGCPPSSPG